MYLVSSEHYCNVDKKSLLEGLSGLFVASPPPPPATDIDPVW